MCFFLMSYMSVKFPWNFFYWDLILNAVTQSRCCRWAVRSLHQSETVTNTQNEASRSVTRQIRCRKIFRDTSGAQSQCWTWICLCMFTHSNVCHHCNYRFAEPKAFFSLLLLESGRRRLLDLQKAVRTRRVKKCWTPVVNLANNLLHTNPHQFLVEASWRPVICCGVKGRIFTRYNRICDDHPVSLVHTKTPASFDFCW